MVDFVFSLNRPFVDKSYEQKLSTLFVNINFCEQEQEVQTILMNKRFKQELRKKVLEKSYEQQLCPTKVPITETEESTQV